MNVSVSPSASDAVGVNEYVLPTVTAPDGDPLITGAEFVGVGVGFGVGAVLKPSLEPLPPRQPARKVGVASKNASVAMLRTVLKF